MDKKLNDIKEMVLELVHSANGSHIASGSIWTQLKNKLLMIEEERKKVCFRGKK